MVLGELVTVVRCPLARGLLRSGSVDNGVVAPNLIDELDTVFVPYVERENGAFGASVNVCPLMGSNFGKGRHGVLCV